MKLKKIISIIAIVGIILGFLIPLISVFFNAPDSGVSFTKVLNII